jgi:glycosyltransferase involved in cell wall biosynthesis
MALGLAPIATATPGPLEIVQDGVNGMVVPARDTDAMTAALRVLTGDRALRDRIRASACETAQRYAWPTIAAQTELLYDRARKTAAAR